MRMRLGIDAWGLSGDGMYSGVGRYAANLLRHLPSYVPHYQVIAYAGPHEARPGWLPDGVVWRSIGTILPIRQATPYWRLRLLARQARVDRLDLFHAPAVHVRPSHPAVPRLACPVITTIHDLIPITYYRLRLPLKQQVFYQWNLKRAYGSTALITVSAASACDIRRYATGGLPRLTVIPNAVDFAPNDDPAVLARLGVTPPFLLYAGSYEPRKNLAGALSAYAILAARGTAHQLVAIVERKSGHAAAIEEQVDALQLRSRIRFLANLPEDDLRVLYTQARCVLFPSWAEGFGFPPLQAASCGTPVVASDLGVLRDHLQDAAVYVDPGDALAMSNAVDRVLHDRALQFRLKSAGPERAARFTLDNWLKAHVEVYEAARRHPLPDPPHQGEGELVRVS